MYIKEVISKEIKGELIVQKRRREKRKEKKEGEYEKNVNFKDKNRVKIGIKCDIMNKVRSGDMIQLENVSKSYKNGVHALRDVTLYIEEGEFVYIIGPTGSGKSTLIKVLDGEEIPDQGNVIVAETNVGKLKHKKVPIYRRNIGVVFQDFRLLPTLTIFENIAFALEVIGLDKVTIRRRVREVLELVSLSDKAKSFPNELSGGQQQRATIGRAIANRPKVLIADEPTGNLDPEMSTEIMELLEKINEEENTTIVMVTHDSTLVNKYKKRTIALEEGYVVADIQKGGYLAHD